MSSHWTQHPRSTVLLAFAGLLQLYGLATMLGLLPPFLNSQDLFAWDARFYQSIAEGGYVFEQVESSNAGFFPLFAWLWALLHASPLAMALINTALFLITTSWLASVFRVDRFVLVLFVVWPFSFFFFVPLTESLFYAWSVLLLVGLERKKGWWVAVAVLGASLTRASVMFLLPAGLGMLLLTAPMDTLRTWRPWARFFWQFVLPAALGLGLVMWVQWLQTGHWGAYVEVQQSVWGREFAWPTIPIGTASPRAIQWLSQLSFVLLSLAGLLLLRWLIQRIRGRELSPAGSPAEVFSFVFLVMGLLSVVFFNPTWFWFPAWGVNGTVITGINRYTQATAFFVLVLHWLFRQKPMPAKYWSWLLPGVYVILLLLAPNYPLRLQNFLIVSVVALLLAWLGLYHQTRWKPLGWSLWLGAALGQLLMFHYFLGEQFQVD